MRPNVAKFLDYWKARLKEKGPDEVKKELREGQTVFLSSKDRRELLKELGLR